MCWKCGKAIQSEFPIGRSMTCPSCKSDVRVCKNCRFYSVGSWHDCAERSDELINDKEKANFCDHFQVNPGFKTDHPINGKSSVSTEGTEKTETHRSAFDDLFKS